MLWEPFTGLWRAITVTQVMKNGRNTISWFTDYISQVSMLHNIYPLTLVFFMTHVRFELVSRCQNWPWLQCLCRWRIKLSRCRIRCKKKAPLVRDFNTQETQSATLKLLLSSMLLTNLIRHAWYHIDSLDACWFCLSHYGLYHSISH